MSSFRCEKCGADILDTEHGYPTGCKHYPLEQQKKVHMAGPKWGKPAVGVPAEEWADDEEPEGGYNYG